MKEFLSHHQIEFQEIDLGTQPEKEDELKQKTGTLIVPAIVVEQRTFLGLFNKSNVFIGFEQNRSEIEALLL
ncbi:MAG: NrdH-redoxin [Bacillaceae bacterium]|nr:NrdH-redoxin [Bacillaceae bacterium]